MTIHPITKERIEVLINGKELNNCCVLTSEQIDEYTLAVAEDTRHSITQKLIDWGYLDAVKRLNTL